MSGLLTVPVKSASFKPVNSTSSRDFPSRDLMIAIWDGLDFGSVDNLDYRDYRTRRSFSSTGPSSWSLDASETGGRTKCPWVGVVGLIALGERAEKVGGL